MQALIDKMVSAFQTVMGWLLDALGTIAQFWNTLVGNIWTWIRGVVLNWWNKLQLVIGNVWDWIVAYLTELWNQAITWVYEHWPWAQDFLKEHLGGFADWLQDQMAALGLEVNIDSLKDSVVVVADYYADAAWLLPLNGVLGIVAATFVTVALLRFVRWIVSAIWITG